MFKVLHLYFRLLLILTGQSNQKIYHSRLTSPSQFSVYACSNIGLNERVHALSVP